MSAEWDRCGLGPVWIGIGADWDESGVGSVRIGIGVDWDRCGLGSVLIGLRIRILRDHMLRDPNRLEQPHAEQHEDHRIDAARAHLRIVHVGGAPAEQEGDERHRIGHKGERVPPHAEVQPRALTQPS